VQKVCDEQAEVQRKGGKKAKDLKGNNDLLGMTRPDLVTKIHQEYLDAGADILETNTFNGTSISLQEYGCEKLAKVINLEVREDLIYVTEGII
jgi:methionine synthase I (cobalamin-dependent)